MALLQGIVKFVSNNVVDILYHVSTSYFIFFESQGCVGAIDGTHIDAHVPLAEQVPFRGRKGITQNVMAACSFDMKFTFVNAGWEGSANDWKIFLTTINNPNMNFPNAPPGNFVRGIFFCMN